MDNLKMQTQSIADEKYAALAALFPNAVSETTDENGETVRAVDTDVLRQEINARLVDGKEERYRFTWPDKRKAALKANEPIAKTLRPCREESVDFDTTENLYIEGDNLDVLKLLRETYLNKVKMIYIDPPYNTGNDFVYRDDFTEDTGAFLNRDGQYDEEGNRMVRNLESNGRIHTDWLNMMYPRLKVARDLLAGDGVIFISIDDNEAENLKKICNEVFGEENFVNNFLWLTGKGKKDTWSRTAQQYILCYAKAKCRLPPFVDTQPAVGSFSNPDNDPRGPWFSGSISFSEERSNKKHPAYFSVTSPSGIVWTRQWQVDSKEEMDGLLAENRVYFGPAPQFDNVPRKKIFPSDEHEIIPSNLLTGLGTTLSANTECDKLFDMPPKKHIFDNPKPIELIKHLIKILNAGNDITVIDFFSGASTTAHAVMRLNAEDGGKRKFIMVQIPETCGKDSDAVKAGYKNICEIGKERNRRAGRKIIDECPIDRTNLDTGFRVFKLDTSNMKDVYYTPEETVQMGTDGFVDNIKPDRTGEDLLFQVMLDLGIPLSAAIGFNDGVWNVNDGNLLACFGPVDTEAVTKIARMKPRYAVFRDSGFIDDAALVNFEQVFSTYSPDTVRRVL
jgi:adenine-specific DNA-methyltransferase